jgi:Holliday junction resolvase
MRSDRFSEPNPEARIAELFIGQGWHVNEKRSPALDGYIPDLIVKKGGEAYAVEIKSMSVGRPDRAIPLLSQAILQAQRYAPVVGAKPLALIYVNQSSPSLFKHLMRFAEAYAPGVAVGVVAEDGGQEFRGDGLEPFNLEPPIQRASGSQLKPALDLFSDLNQWMLKVLIAPEIDGDLLSAPRNEYRNASQLALASGVSVMSASRFINLLRAEGFLEESPSLALVRRPELFRRWQSVALRPSSEMPLKALIAGQLSAQLHKLASGRQACLGLFAAANALNIGHVEGVPAYVYVRRLPASGREVLGLASAPPMDRVDVILRQPRAPQSVFRGAVERDGVRVSDVIQVWLDVSSHPSRGKEQAALIEREVLSHVIRSQ